MKTIFTTIFAGVLMSALCVAFIACNKPVAGQDDEKGTEIQAVKVSEEVAVLLNENLFMIVRALFDDGKLAPAKDGCVMINSADELPKADYKGTPFIYPDIDFDKYTLVIGCVFVSSAGGWGITNRSVVVSSKKVTMKMRVENTGHGAAIPSFLNFYGLYPKLPPLSINVVRK